MSSAPLSVRLEGLRKAYRIYRRPIDRLLDSFGVAARGVEDRVVLEVPKLQISAGERVGVIGFNGSGKTTLLKLVAGLTPPTEGELETRGRVTALFRHGAAFRGELSGRENLRREALLHGLDEATFVARRPAMEDFSELGAALDRPLHTYSTGMIARLGLAVMAHLDAEVLLIDEILAGGDLYFQEKSFEAMRRLCERGKLVLLVSHDMEVILRSCTRVIWLHRGEVVADGEPRDVCWRYYREVYFDHWHRLNADVVREAEAIPAGELRGHLLSPERHWGSGEMRFTKVELAGADEQPIEFGRVGETLRLRFHYETREPLAEVAFLADVRTPLQTLVTSAMSHLTGDRLEGLDGVGIIEVELPALSFPPGHYLVNFGAYPASDGFDYNRYYAHHAILLGNEFRFEVREDEECPPPTGRGIEVRPRIRAEWSSS